MLWVDSIKIDAKKISFVESDIDDVIVKIYWRWGQGEMKVWMILPSDDFGMIFNFSLHL